MNVDCEAIDCNGNHKGYCLSGAELEAVETYKGQIDTLGACWFSAAIEIGKNGVCKQFKKKE